MKPILLIYLLMTWGFGYCQVVSNSCINALIICDNDSRPLTMGASPIPIIPNFGSVSNPSTNPNGTNSGCLPDGEFNPNWYIIDILSSGTLEFAVSFTGGGSGFLDWAMWVYDTSSCQDIEADALPPVACNMNYASAGLTGMASVANMPAGADPGNFETPINVSYGDRFIICICNTQYVSGNFTFTYLGTSTVCQSSVSLETIEASTQKEIIGIVDVMGRTVSPTTNQLLIYQYADGTTEMIFRIE